MKKLNAILLTVAILIVVVPSNLFARERASIARTVIVKEKKSSYKPKRNKKAVRNYTHNLPANGATATTWSAAKKYNKITKLALKNSFQKWTLRRNEGKNGASPARG